jgi:hypothetical protein
MICNKPYNPKLIILMMMVLYNYTKIKNYKKSKKSIFNEF